MPNQRLPDGFVSRISNRELKEQVRTGRQPNGRREGISNRELKGELKLDILPCPYCLASQIEN